MKNFLVLVLISTLFFGCTKRSLDDETVESKVIISFQWSKLPDWDSPSDSMKLYFYGEDGRVFIKNASSKGFTGTLPAQNYDILAFNTDAKGIEHKNLNDFMSATVVATVPQTKGGDIIVQPERAYGVSLGNITIEDGKVQSYVLSPMEYAKKANFKFNFSGEVSSVKNCQAKITGVSKGLKMHNGELLTQDSDIASVIVDNVDKADFDIDVNLFGIVAADSSSQLTLDFVFEDNSTKNLALNISDVFKNITTGVNVTVFVDILKEAEGNFTAKLKSWVSSSENIGLK